jgi:chromosomal replication initiation ATPase DnaA
MKKNEMLSMIANTEGVTIREIKTKSRRREVNYPRMAYMFFQYIIEKSKPINVRKTLKVIGNDVNRDHATVLHAFKVCCRDLKYHKAYREKIHDYRERMGMSEGEFDYLLQWAINNYGLRTEQEINSICPEKVSS